jgi:peptidoglycan/xylan/chitin deacetylase (PgdA/CDA1 family)
MTARFLGLKIDVDTLRGYREGVPRLLDLLARHGVRASFFFSFGPDNSGKAIRRVFRPGFLSKMGRTGPVSTYGLRTLLYGTLLPAPLIVPSEPDLVVRTGGEGHECGIHAWDHVKWQDELDRLDEGRIEEEFLRARELFEQLLGRPPRSCAAPGWQANARSLRMQDRMDLAYCSDARGREPFFPVIDGEAFATLQIPTTTPTMDELLGRDSTDEGNFNDRLMATFGDVTVHTIHAEMEGLRQLPLLDDLLRRCRDQGLAVVPLADLAAAVDRKKTPRRELRRGTLPGRAGTLALQS